MGRPVIGICAAVERADFGPWRDEPATLLPLSYARAIHRRGAIAILLPPDEIVTGAPDEVLDRIDALVLAGGADVDPASHQAQPHPETKGTNPERDRFELALVRRALERDLPVLGICRGMQLLNTSTGGTLHQHLPERLGHEEHRPTPGEWAQHEVHLAAGSLVARAAGAERLRVKSHHHQGIEEPGAGLEISGWADGDELIEAIESPGHRFALGVLWHPEEDPEDHIIAALVETASS